MDEINADPHFKVTAFIGDMVERHYVKGLVSVNGTFGCEVCKAAARGRQKWPAETYGQEYRTTEEMRAISRYFPFKFRSLRMCPDTLLPAQERSPDRGRRSQRGDR